MFSERLSPGLHVIGLSIWPAVLETQVTGFPDVSLPLFFQVPRLVHHRLHVPSGAILLPLFWEGFCFLANSAKAGGGLESTELLEVL